jgi:hypothetical protein
MPRGPKKHASADAHYLWLLIAVVPLTGGARPGE